MKILVINSGSSSIKYKLFDMQGMESLADGVIERIGTDSSILHHEDKTTGQTVRRELSLRSHEEGFALMAQVLSETGTIGHISEISAIGHRVVHGGRKFKRPVLIDSEVTSAIKRLVPLAPLHNPANLAGIQVAMSLAPDVPQVAVFDTAFHQTMPEEAYLYALPRKFHEKFHVRRYGFHGTSHSYVSRLAADFLHKDFSAFNCISLHLGNGASAAAIRGGRSIDTSMGMTPLEGLIMGTRSGDIDPAIIFYLSRVSDMDLQEIDHVLNFQSGLLGICGENDMRTITHKAEEGDGTAQLALDMFCHRLKKYIGAYFALLGRTDCIIFTGGIGENSPLIREHACDGLEHMGIILDSVKNNSRSGKIMEIGAEGAGTRILVVPTDEELEIARQTQRTAFEQH